MDATKTIFWFWAILLYFALTFAAALFLLAVIAQS